MNLRKALTGPRAFRCPTLTRPPGLCHCSMLYFSLFKIQYKKTFVFMSKVFISVSFLTGQKTKCLWVFCTPAGLLIDFIKFLDLWTSGLLPVKNSSLYIRTCRKCSCICIFSCKSILSHKKLL